jgi:hypothetical protein
MHSSRHIFIGDVHGCIQELDMLLEKISLKETDILVFIGDLIDKGPNSSAVVKRFFELKSTFQVKLILGNHEEKFLRYLKHIENRTGKEKEMKGTEEFPDLIKNLKPDEINSLKDAYYSLHFPEIGYTALHGGLVGNIAFNFPTDFHYQKDNPKELKILNLFTKTRYLNPKGKFVGLGEEKAEDRFWADAYDGKYGNIVFGHQSFMQDEVKEFPFAVGIDGACVFGGKLTAMIIENDSRSYVQVSALRAYADLKTK